MQQCSENFSGGFVLDWTFELGERRNEVVFPTKSVVKPPPSVASPLSKLRCPTFHFCLSTMTEEMTIMMLMHPTTAEVLSLAKGKWGRWWFQGRAQRRIDQCNPYRRQRSFMEWKEIIIEINIVMSIFSFSPLDDNRGDDNNEADAPDHRRCVITCKGEVEQAVVPRPCLETLRLTQHLLETEKFYGMKGK